MEAILPLLVIMAIMILPMMWLSSRQRKAQAQQMERVKALGVGDEVRTHAGFIGLIVESYDDTVILEDESGSHSKWLRRAIAGLAEDPTAPGAAPASTTSDAREAEDATGEEPEAGSRPLGADDTTASAPAERSSTDAARRDGDVPGVTR